MATMKLKYLAVMSAAIATAAGTAVGVALGDAGNGEASPIYGVKLPENYRLWPLIAPAQESAPLDELRAVLGNDLAIKAYQDSKLPFPDGTVLVKLAWKHVQSPEFEPASIPGAATTGGWGFGRFISGKPSDEAQHQTCFACHQARVRNHDFVFTRFAP
jgi:hypothetical protein